MSEQTASRGGLGTGPKIVLVGSAFVILMAGLQQVGNIVGPVFLALTLAITMRPLTSHLGRRGLPRWVGTIAVLAVIYALLITMFSAVGLAIGQLATTLPDYSDRFTELYHQLTDGLAHIGVDDAALNRVRDQFSFTSVLGLVQTLLGQLSSITTLVLFLLLSLAFLVLDTADMDQRIAIVRAARPHLLCALDDFCDRVRRYWLYSAVFGVILAVGDYIALLLLGVPFPLTWAIVAFICNFIPNIGFAVAVVPPALLALLADGPVKALWVLGAFIVISFVVQTLLLPKFMGDAVGLNTTTTFISLLFWAGIIGPLGALLAIPLTLFLRAVLIDSTPELRWVGAFLSSEPDPPSAPSAAEAT